jgi:FkbM family methyltransferase
MKIALDGVEIAACRHGTMVWPATDDTIGRALRLYGEFAEGENLVIARFLRPGATMLDIGANLGTTVLPAARAVGPAGTIVAFEPQPPIAQCLQTTLTVNGIFNVRVLACAAGDASGWALLPAPGIGATGNFGAVALGAEGIRVPVLAIDALELPRCDLIKIDVEGLEWPVVQGARRTLLALRPVVYFEAKRNPGTTSCLAWLRENGWRCYWHFAFFFRKLNFRGNPDNVFVGIGDMNVLAVPAGAEAPGDLPEIAHPDEDWSQTYVAFHRARGTMPE